jgi:hypothetical protein
MDTNGEESGSVGFRVSIQNFCEMATSYFVQDHVTPPPLSFEKLLGDSFKCFLFIFHWDFPDTWKL